MRSALDSCVALKWLLNEADSAKALSLRADFLAGSRDFIAPDVFPVEIAHSLTRAERQRRITPAEGLAHFQDLATTLPSLFPSLPLLPRAYDLSSRFRVGVYDCLYVALAEREGCELVTADDRLVKSLQPQFSFVVALAAVP
ncbi:MAG TPA: type II toxin-antitoxin system VapC family toxin [Gemmataceae bacterium]|jgi:predicted nucleic acid-binding protein|nr:type II toxin-antitoxin system VapC family toxin [Gemmataceae bacterium]